MYFVSVQQKCRSFLTTIYIKNYNQLLKKIKCIGFVMMQSLEPLRHRKTMMNSGKFKNKKI